MVDFIPEQIKAPGIQVPYFEDVKASDIPGRRTERPLDWYEEQIRNLLARLGAGSVVFTVGQFPTMPKRHGYRITFSLNGVSGRMDVAALPMRGEETAKKKKQALAQALFLFRNWLESEVLSTVYRPGAVSLIPYLIGAGGKTVTEVLLESGQLPQFGGYLPPVTGA